jgi:hypothetical protein
MGELLLLRPHRDALVDLTRETNETGVDPFEAYELLCRRLGSAGLWFDTYLSSSITSGGHARNTDLGIGEVIQRNTQMAFDLADELYANFQLEAGSSIEAVALGKIKHWSQSDYMTFWLSVMSGLKFQGPGAAAEMDQFRSKFDGALSRGAVDMASYNNPQLPPDQRAPHYFGHADVFATVGQEQDSFKPISRLVRLVDTDTSLGAQTERYFAKVNGTKVFQPAIAHIGDLTLPDSYPAPRLVRDTESIVKYGGHVFDTVRRTKIILVEEEAA